MTKKINISLLLILKNEEKNLLKHWNWLGKCQTINEIIIIDDNSTDKSVQIIKKLENKNLKIKVFKKGLDNNFSNQRNFGIDKTINDYVLWLDADEKPSNNFIRFLNHIDNLKYKNYAFKRQDIFLGHKLKHGETSSQYFLRLFDKNYGRFNGTVHEVWQSSQKINYQQLPIYHYPHSSLKSFIQKINFYSDLRSQELFDQNQKVSLLDIIIYPVGKFFQNYFFRLGFLDKTPGIIFALGMSFHSFLVRSKLWHLSHR